MLSRRQFLAGAAGSLASAAISGFGRSTFGEELPLLNDGELIPSPDFERLRAEAPYIIGVRPHRHGGVRLEQDSASLAGTTRPKILIHNYGHGGSGITLSFGCASVVGDLLERALAQRPRTAAPVSIAVIGVGVSGLASATEIHRRWPALPLTLYARSKDVSTTTSYIAGGQFEPSGIYHEYVGDERKAVLGDLLRRSRTRIVELQASRGDRRLGIASMRDFTLDHDNPAVDEYTPRDVVPAYRRGRLPFAHLRDVGRQYRNWLLNPRFLLPQLLADLTASGAAVRERTFANAKDVAALPEDVVINCTGYGAKALWADEQVVPQRGHLVVLQKSDPKPLYFFSGGCPSGTVCYLFCRQDDIVVGGSVITGNDSTVRSPEDGAVFERLLRNGREVFGGHVDRCRG